MPSYKTHSIHMELIYKYIKTCLELDVEYLKIFGMGPDALTLSDTFLFQYQHDHKVREYFLAMLEYIKANHLEYNPRVMEFLYGQLDHLATDATIHPYIYFMTQRLNNGHLYPTHGLTEVQMDDYVCNKFGKTQKDYYQRTSLGDKELSKMVDRINKDVFGRKHEAMKYDLGFKSVKFFDQGLRRNMLGIVRPVVNAVNIGDFTYAGNPERIREFLNEKGQPWCDPETGETFHKTFDALFNESTARSLEASEDIYNHLYNGKKLNCKLILEDTSYNTGHPCEQGQSLRFTQKWN